MVVYLAVVTGLNVIRQLVFPPSEVSAILTLLLFVAVLAVTFVVVTPAWRLLAGPARERR